MAKAKKEQSTEAAEGKPAAPKAAKKPAAKKAPAKTRAAAAPAGMPMIDTSLAAQTAAKLVARRDLLQSAGSQDGRQESSAFKQMKEGLANPASQGPSSFLQNSAPQKKSNQSFGGLNQVSRNQTFGADVNRSGVPRRTGG